MAIKPEVGQLWKGKSDGYVYSIKDHVIKDGLSYYLLMPMDKGRSSWKYGPHIEFDLDYIGNYK